jgi:hypothetical protein
VPNQSFIQHLDLLAGSLALDEEFRREFSQDRLGAIQRFNAEFAPRYRQRPIELTENEKRLVNALNARSVDEFISLLAVITGGLTFSNRLSA